MTAEQIGTTVRQARLTQRLRQDQLAAAAGVGVRFLIELEHGKPTVQLGKVLAVLNALGCRVEVGAPPTPPASAADGAHAGRQEEHRTRRHAPGARRRGLPRHRQ